MPKSIPCPASDTASPAARVPLVTPHSAELRTVDSAVESASEAIAGAVHDLLARARAGHDPPAMLLESIAALMQGMSPDEAAQLRSLILEGNPADWRNSRTRHPDEELASGWREGGYPYRNLMSRRAYERQKYRLQVELLKLQAWVRETGQRVVILFEGPDAAGKGGTIKHRLRGTKRLLRRLERGTRSRHKLRIEPRKQDIRLLQRGVQIAPDLLKRHAVEPAHDIRQLVLKFLE